MTHPVSSSAILREIYVLERRLLLLLEKAREAAKQGQRQCPWCNEFAPPSCFTRGAKKYADPPCNACYNETYPRRITQCAVCGGRIDTNGHAKQPTHKRCREAVRA